MCLHPSGQTAPPPPTAPPSPRRRERGRGGHRPAAVPLFTAPDRGPRCAHGQQQQFEQYQSPVGPRTCKCSSIYDMTVILLCVCVYIYTMYIYKERDFKKKKKAQSIKPNLAGLQTVQKLYCTLSISSAHQPKAIHYLAQTQFSIR